MVIGLTGGIASGKTLVAGEWRRLGAFIVDADAIAKTLLEKGTPEFKRVVAEFGPGIVLSGGELNRVELGRTIFSDAKKREVLNAIMHPEIRRRIRADVEAIKRDNPGAIIIVDAALMYENGLDKEMDKVIVVLCDDDKMVERMMKRNRITEREALERLASQMPVVEKALKADYIIDNNNRMEDTLNLARLVFEELKKG